MDTQTSVMTGPVDLTMLDRAVNVIAFDGAGPLLRGRPAEFRHHGLRVTTRQSAIDALLELGREPGSVALVPIDTTEIPAARIIELARLLTPVPVIAGISAGDPENELSELFERGVATPVSLPVTPQRLLSAITGVTAASGKAKAPPTTTQPIMVGSLILDDVGHQVRWHDVDVLLPPKSFAVLRQLMLAHPRVVSLDELTGGSGARGAQVHSAIGRARAAFAKAVPWHPGPIQTVHRVGYRIHDECIPPAAVYRT